MSSPQPQDAPPHQLHDPVRDDVHRDGHAPLHDQLQRAFAAVLAQRPAADAAPQWLDPDAELLERFLAAKKYAHQFIALLAFAQTERPSLTASELTAEFLQRQDNGKILRKASLHYARAHRVDTNRARHRLLLAVNLTHYGADLLAQLSAGKISPQTAELAAAKLNSIPEPDPKQDQTAGPWAPGAYDEARRQADQAKRQLGAELSELAQHSASDGDFKQGADELREQHHPEPAHLRHARAVKKRYLRTRAAADGMTYLEAYLSTGQAETALRTIKALAGRRRATGRATTLTSNQLLADVTVELLTGHTQPAGLADPARSTSSGEPSPKQAGTPITPVQPRIFLMLTLAEWVNLGGYLDPSRMGYLNKHYPQLYRQAEKNRAFYGQDPGNRRGRHPAAIHQSGATAAIVGSANKLATAEAATLTAQAAMMSVLLTDPVTGYPLGTTKRVRRVSPEVAELVTIRDQYCRYPGCREPAVDCELDHVNEFADGGHSSYRNSACLCREHHVAKSAGWLTVHPDPTGGDGALVFVETQTDHKRYTQPALPLDDKAWQAYKEAEEAANPPPF